MPRLTDDVVGGDAMPTTVAVPGECSPVAKVAKREATSEAKKLLRFKMESSSLRSRVSAVPLRRAMALNVVTPLGASLFHRTPVRTVPPSGCSLSDRLR